MAKAKQRGPRRESRAVRIQPRRTSRASGRAVGGARARVARRGSKSKKQLLRAARAEDEEAGARCEACERADNAAEMLLCDGCDAGFHLRCLDTNLESKPELWDKWRCLECKQCEVCKKDGSKIRLAICEDCDEGYHIECLDPPLKSFPHRNFKCPKCVKCSSCGTRTAKAWRSDYTMCKPCGTLFRDRRFCAICLSDLAGDDATTVGVAAVSAALPSRVSRWRSRSLKGSPRRR